MCADVSPVATNGIGTFVMGNCGCAFAPCDRGDRNFLIELMEGVEDIPQASLQEGMGTWQWESVPEWLDHAATLPMACDFAALVGHGALRTYCMGERGADHEEEVADEDIEVMAAVLRQAVEAGALGWGVNRSDGHKDKSGNPVPGTYSEDNEMVALAEAIHAGGGGVIEIVSRFIFPSTCTSSLPLRLLGLKESAAQTATTTASTCSPRSGSCSRTALTRACR